MKRVHFIFSGTEAMKGGGTTLWRLLLKQPSREVWLHYSSYAQGLWEDVSHPLLHHVIHEGWGTYGRAETPLPWQKARRFSLSLIEEGDVVVFDAREALQQLALPLAKKGVKLFWHMQSKERILRKRLWIVPWDMLCYRALDGIVGISQFVKRHFERDPLYPLLGKKIPFEILYNGVNSSFERILPEHDFVVYFGRYEDYKNPLFLERLGCKVCYIGSKEGCSEPIEVPKEKDLGWMSPKEAARWGDIFIFPSVGEAFGLALVEMMSYGKIVIAFRSGAFPEIIEDGVDGFLVEPFDVKSVRELIETLKNSPELRNRISLAAQEKARHYEGKKYREQFWKLMEKMVEGGFGVSS